ncbi:hypothetical protein FGO68_gene10317 [Halteria grandinella]|uniref:EF-hand domain-containing protein n=1 Tax=Halteria grandinella TaxID=5974 RepID=A0A8J8SXE6_HALGN|nr:hypothetical protein FGO68_gene10317 [Halteria grandinella]
MQNNTNSSVAGLSFGPGAASTYEQWKESVSAQLRYQHMNQPKINENSRRIIEHKRMLNNVPVHHETLSRKPSPSGGNISVHHRLHQQAVSKQRQYIPHNNNVMGQTFHSNSNNPLRRVLNLSAQNSPSHQHRSQSAQDNGNNSSLKRSAPRELINYGERLYIKGLKRKEEQSRLLKEVKAQQEMQKLNQFCSFQPQINEVSRIIAHPLRGEGQSAEDALIKYGVQARERVEQKRSERLFREVAECRFHPQISKKSELMVRQKAQGGYESDGGAVQERDRQAREKMFDDKFSSLYYDALRRKERQEKVYARCMAPDFTFQPDTRISKYYYQRLEARDPAYQHKTLALPPQTPNHGHANRTNSVPHSRHKRNLSADGRYHEKERLHRSLKKSSTLSNDLFDPETHQWNFHPKVGRGPRNQHRPEKGGLATAQMLYEQSKALQEKMEQKKRYMEQQMNRDRKQVHTIDRSRGIIEELKIKHFQTLFRRLDSDQDGQISSQRIDITWLPSQLIDVLQLIFAEMEESGHTLTEEEFIDATFRLYDSLPISGKRVLFDAKEVNSAQKDKKKSYNGHQFKPKLDSNSIKIAAQKRSHHEDIAQILYRKKKEYDQRVQEKVQEKENQELLGCTFHPNIIQSPQSGIKVYGNGGSLQNSRGSFGGGAGNIPYNSSQHIATFLNNNNNNNAGSQQQFDLNTLAYNVASEYMIMPRPSSQSLNVVVNNNSALQTIPEVRQQPQRNMGLTPVLQQKYGNPVVTQQ